MTPRIVIAGSDPQSIVQKPWMADQVRHDSQVGGMTPRIVIAGSDPQSIVQKPWMPDQVRDDELGPG